MINWQILSYTAGAIVSVYFIFKYMIYNPLTSLISRMVDPLNDSINSLKESIDQLNASSKDEFKSIHKELDMDDQRIKLTEKSIAVHEEQIKQLKEEDKNDN
ncbi:hypothetical protein OYT88_12410 [Sporolactobacillus sp. CQH2019]|uniref:hypothetical protein n=1 Tax=Sporolactobacillus sp. CQH2019 TaxID=3023512 RepID=UPI0023685EA2|nr:hypothetical protein [Sporolactobacillus sp. CQH2019]MDD9149344.1 hypothetical protein [Sporolactobacillus sp. CQH2019]